MCIFYIILRLLTIISYLLRRKSIRHVEFLQQSIPDICLLYTSHRIGILLQADQLVLLRRPVEQQILKQLFLRAVIIQHTVFQLCAERAVELLILFAVVRHQLHEFLFDLLLEVVRDELELPVVLEHLTRNVQAEILRIDHAARCV